MVGARRSVWLVGLLLLALAGPSAAGPRGEADGLIVQGPFLFCGDETAMLHILYRDRALIHGMGIFCGINGYTKPDDLEKVAYEKKKGEVVWKGKVRGTGITFEQTASVAGDRIRVRVKRGGVWPEGVWGGFQINLPLTDYGGAEYVADGKRYLYPADYAAGWKFPSGIRKLECHTGNPSRNIIFEYADGISIEDHRRFNEPRYVVSIGLPGDGRECEFFITLPDLADEPPQRAVRWSRIGYPASGEKVAILEWPKRTAPPDDRVRVEERNGKVLKKGRFGRTQSVYYMQNDYATFDFSEVKAPGEYRVVWSGGETDWFPIRASVFEDRLWHPTLDTFIPFEMCHAAVSLPAGSIGHGACHLDDGARVPPHFTGPDGFVSYECEGTPYKAGDHIPLAVGGWHDAGDFDLNVPAQSYVVWMLALAWEEFHLDRDVATLDTKAAVFTPGRPDGTSDILSQVEWGAAWLLLMQQPDGRVWNGVCEREGRRSGKPVDRMTDGKPGTEDDRQVYVDYHADTQLNFVIAMAAASRALKGARPEIAGRCLDASRRAFAYFQGHPEVYRPGSYAAARVAGKERDASVMAAAIELYLTTGEAAYLEAAQGLAGSLAELKLEWPLPRDTQTGGFRYVPPFLARLHPRLPAGSFKDAVTALCRRAAGGIAERAALRPWPLETWEFGMWGNNGTGLARAFDVYWLTRVAPDVLPPAAALRTMLWVFGLHPTCDTVFVAGLGYPEPRYLYNCHLHAVNGSAPGTVPGAVVPGMGGFWMSGVVTYIDEYGWYGHNEACIYTAAQCIFAVNAMRAMGY